MISEVVGILFYGKRMFELPNSFVSLQHLFGGGGVLANPSPGDP